MYVLANDDGSPKLGSILDNRVNSVMEVFRTDKLLEDDNLEAIDTLASTEFRNSSVREEITGFVTDVDDGIKCGNVS